MKALAGVEIQLQPGICGVIAIQFGRHDSLCSPVSLGYCRKAVGILTPEIIDPDTRIDREAVRYMHQFIDEGPRVKFINIPEVLPFQRFFPVFSIR